MIRDAELSAISAILYSIIPFEQRVAHLSQVRGRMRPGIDYFLLEGDSSPNTFGLLERTYSFVGRDRKGREGRENSGRNLSAYLFILGLQKLCIWTLRF